MKIKTIGIIGCGEFGMLLYQYLSPHYTTLTYDKDTTKSHNTLSDVAQCDLIIFAVPARNLEEACRQTKPLIAKDTIIMDVMSVKLYPIKILQKYFPKHQIIGTHPVFGIASSRYGIAGQPMVMMNVSASNDVYKTVKSIFTDTLQLHIVEQSADQHDREMAWILGLSHFIGRALHNLDMKEYATGTRSYKDLLLMSTTHGNKSQKLFETIQKYNPYAQAVRDDFVKELQNIKNVLGGFILLSGWTAK